MAETAAPEAELDDVTFTLSWRMKDGGLSGELEAVNISNRSVRLSGKPGLTPIGMDDRPWIPIAPYRWSGESLDTSSCNRGNVSAHLSVGAVGRSAF
jgi:hypothetical protein